MRGKIISNSESSGKSPAKIWQFLVNNPAVMGAAISAGGSILGGLFGNKRRKREQKAAQVQHDQMRADYMAVDFKNPYKDLTNQFANLKNRYAGQQNVMEDVTVNLQQANFQKQASQQQMANIMSNMQGAAGGSGVAGLAQALANQSVKAAAQASASIGTQEQAIKLATAKEAGRLQQMEIAGAAKTDYLKAAGQQAVDLKIAEGETKREEKEMSRLETLYGMSMQRSSAANTARNTATQNMVTGVTSGIGGVMSGMAESGTGIFAPGFEFKK